jgi:hypothetical protein
VKLILKIWAEALSRTPSRGHSCTSAFPCRHIHTSEWLHDIRIRCSYLRTRPALPPERRISNLLTWSPITKPPSHIKHISQIEKWVSENPTENSDPRGRHFRPLVGALDPLINHCSLTTLRISTLGKDAAGSSSIDSRHHRLYEAWASCLHSMRETLQIFSFDQDVNSSFSTCATRRYSKEYRDVDVLFSQWILPVL